MSHDYSNRTKFQIWAKCILKPEDKVLKRFFFFEFIVKEALNSLLRLYKKVSQLNVRYGMQKFSFSFEILFFKNVLFYEVTKLEVQF